MPQQSSEAKGGGVIENFRIKRDALKFRLGMTGVAAVAGIGNVGIGLFEWASSRQFGSQAFNVAAAHDIFGDGLTYGMQIGALSFASRGHDRLSHTLRTTARLGLIGMSGYFATKAGFELLTNAPDNSMHSGHSLSIAGVALALNGGLLWFDHNHEADFHDHPQIETISEHEETKGDVIRHITTDAIEGLTVISAASLGVAGMYNADRWSILVGQSAATAIMAWPWITRSSQHQNSH